MRSKQALNELAGLWSYRRVLNIATLAYYGVRPKIDAHSSLFGIIEIGETMGKRSILRLENEWTSPESCFFIEPRVVLHLGKYCYEYQPDVSKSEMAMQVAKAFWGLVFAAVAAAKSCEKKH